MSVAPGTEGIKRKKVSGRGTGTGRGTGRGRGAVNLGASLHVSLTVMHTGFISVGGWGGGVRVCASVCV